MMAMGLADMGNEIKITFGMIVLNGEPFVRYNLRALYPFAHQIIVVEGSCPAARGVAGPDGHSKDGTLETLARFSREEDPENKILILRAEDDGHPDGFWPGEKMKCPRLMQSVLPANGFGRLTPMSFICQKICRRLSVCWNRSPRYGRFLSAS